VPAFTPPAAGVSLRQQYELMTATGPHLGQPSANPAIDCAKCHARMDPIGFLFEPYDTIGQFRTIDDYGAPVDLTNITIIQSLDPSLDGLTASSMQLAQKLASSDQPNLCLMSNLYRFMAHRDDGPADAPAEAELDAIFDGSGANLSPVLVGLTQTSPFLERLDVP
jgi:uncharacterized protein DUF1588